LHPRKTLTTGEGGILTTKDEATASRLRRLRSHGMERAPTCTVFREAGFNYRLTDFQAALGRAQLPNLAGWIEARHALAEQYRQALAPLEAAGLLTLPIGHLGHSWQTFMVVLADGIDRAAAIRALAERGIESNLGAQCVSAEPAFVAHLPPGGSLNARRLARQGLALPFCEQYGANEIDRVRAALSLVLEDASVR
jgi:dTDP-4-amino-4,6-dideoxygalactose transaminase